MILRSRVPLLQPTTGIYRLAPEVPKLARTEAVPFLAARIVSAGPEGAFLTLHSRSNPHLVWFEPLDEDGKPSYWNNAFERLEDAQTEADVLNRELIH